MIVAFFMGAVLLGLAGLAWVCDRMDAHDDLLDNEYRLRCQAFHPSGRRWE